MKKSFLFVALLSFYTLATAQDLIVKTNAEELQVKVINVGEKEITYLKWDNQDGPTYTVSVPNVLYIKYANGQKDVFTTIEQNQELTRYVYPTSYITRSGQTYILDGYAMRHEEYSRFLQRCPSAYDVFKQGLRMAQAGWPIFAIGCFLDILCVASAATTSASVSTTYLGVAAGVLEIVSIPTLIVGYCKMHNSADIFNTQCAKQQPTAYWSINADSNGIGLAFNF